MTDLYQSYIQKILGVFETSNPQEIKNQTYITPEQSAMLYTIKIEMADILKKFLNEIKKSSIDVSVLNEIEETEYLTLKEKEFQSLSVKEKEKYNCLSTRYTISLLCNNWMNLVKKI